MAGNGEEQQVDALIVTAVKDEYDAVLLVEAGASPGSAWETQPGPLGLDVAFRTFLTPTGQPLRLAVTQAPGMGGGAATNAAVPLVALYKPLCIAMCGVCAGRRRKVNPGDVIVADRTWYYDAGKRKAEVDEVGQRHELFLPDPSPSLLDHRWQQHAERFFDRFPTGNEEWLGRRPRSYEAQANWLLERVLLEEDVTNHSERTSKCAEYSEVLRLLWDHGHLERGTLNLTDKGRQHIKQERMLHPDGLPEPTRFRVRIGPMGSGNSVVEDYRIFEDIAAQNRKVIGLEMEAAAIGEIARYHDIPRFIVMKGVMDHADTEKSDHFRLFAARASAECLIAFLRQHLPPREPQKATRDPLDEILVPGTSDLPVKASPAALLNARHEVVDFFGREELIAKLRAWCETDEKSVGTRLIYGAGGMGKTRLFIELCQRMREAGWRAGFVPKGLDVERFAELVADDRPTLAVIDYAESRPNLRALLEPVAKRRNDGREGRVRVVLLARNAGDWWDTLLSADGDVKDLLSEHEVLVLEPLVPVASERDALFRKAVEGFAEHLEKTVPEQPAPSLENERFERVLYVQMAALAYVEGRSFRAESLMDDTLDHEQRFWGEAFQDRGDRAVRALVPEIRRVVSALTLKGGAESEVEALALVEQFVGARDKELRDFLRDLYPGRQEQEATYLSGLEPDLLGEAMVWRTLTHEGGGVGAYLDRVFESAGERALLAGFTVLGRLSEEHAEAEAWIARVLDHDVAGRALLAFEAAKTVGERTAHSPIGKVLARALEREGTIEIAKQIEEAGLPEQTVLLRQVALWATATRLAQLPERPETLSERAQLLNNLANRQSDLSRYEEALVSAVMAVAIRRELAERSEAFLPDLAMSLNNLSLLQSALGRREGALASIQQAVAICFELTKSHSDTFQADLAISLTNRGKIQRELGMHEEALASTKEAVVRLRKLMDTQPDLFQPELARSLINLGNMQSAPGRREQALACTQEAVEHYRKLAAARPDAFLPDLAMSLNNLGIRQSALGRREQALACTQEAVEIRRKLAVAQPNAFQPDLARSLTNLGNRQSELGLHEEALASAQEALEAIWPFFVALPRAFARNTGIMLRNVLNRLDALEREPTPELLQRMQIFVVKTGDPGAGEG